MLNTDKSPNEARIRDHLANERTFLAWIRTCLGIMAFGFVVEKSSLFIKEIATLLGKPHWHQGPSFLLGSSSIFGIALVALGAIICLLAYINYKVIEQHIEQATYLPKSSLNTLLTICIILIGILLVFYLSLSL